MAGKERAQRLLDAHVAYVVEQLSGKGFEAWLEATVRATLEDAARLKLKDAVPAKQLKYCVVNLMAELEIDDALRAAVQDIARAVVDSEAHADARIGELVEPEVFEAARDKAIAMRTLREEIVGSLLQSKAYRGFVADLLYHGIQGWVTNNPLTDTVPGAKRALAFGRSVLNRARPGIDAELDRRLRDYIDKSVDASAEIGEAYLLGVKDEDLRRGADALWRQAADIPVSEVLDGVNGDDAADWAGIAYDGIHHLRKTPYVQQLVEEGIDAYYAHFGELSLADIVGDVGLDADLLRREISRFTQPVVKLLKKKKLLEPAIRRQLEPFYLSEAAQAILNE